MATKKAVSKVRVSKAVKTAVPAVEVKAAPMLLLPLLPAIEAHNLEPKNAEELIAKQQAIALMAGYVAPAEPKQATRLGRYVGKKYNRPVKLGDCLTIWEWLDLNPHATRAEAKACEALSHINPITIGVQFKHWTDNQ